MAKFELGQVVVTAGIHNKITADQDFHHFVINSFYRFLSGDWGELCTEDKEEMDKAVKNGNMIMGEYRSKKRGEKIWIITEADRHATTILFPHER